MIHKQTNSPPSKLLWMAPCCVANRAMQPLRNEILGRAINLYIAELCWMFDLKKWRRRRRLNSGTPDRGSCPNLLISQGDANLRGESQEKLLEALITWTYKVYNKDRVRKNENTSHSLSTVGQYF